MQMALIKNGMIKFVLDTFQLYRYQVLGYFNGIFILKMEGMEDYWLIAESLEAYNRQSKIHDELANGFLKDYPKFEKNTSLLLLVKGEAKYEDNMNIEKDPFVFKKYVLNYTDEAYAELVGMVEQYKGIENAVMREEVFKSLADGSDNGGATLLYGLMHKLPFIPINANPVGEMVNPMTFTKPQFHTWLEKFDNMTDSADDVSQFIDSLLIDENNEEA